MNYNKCKFGYNIPHKIILVKESYEKLVPEYLYLMLEFNVKNKEKLALEEFLQFKVILNDKETTIDNLKKGEW